MVMEQGRDQAHKRGVPGEPSSGDGVASSSSQRAVRNWADRMRIPRIPGSDVLPTAGRLDPLVRSDDAPLGASYARLGYVAGERVCMLGAVAGLFPCLMGAGLIGEGILGGTSSAVLVGARLLIAGIAWSSLCITGGKFLQTIRDGMAASPTDTK